MNKTSREAIRSILILHYEKVGITIINNLSDLDELVSKKPDLVFLGMKFLPSNPSLGFADPDKVWLNEYLIEHGIVCTGSSSFAHRLDSNKPLAKQRVLDAGLTTSAYDVIKMNQRVVASRISKVFPLFVKPTDRGGGAGVDSKSVVNYFKRLQDKISSITDTLGSDSLIEQYLPGREFSVAILKKENSVEYSIMPIELVAPQDNHGSRLLSKYVKSEVPLPAIEIEEQNIKTAICDLAINVFHALGARDYGRIDIRLDQFGIPHFLEANLIPSLIKNYGSFPKALVLNMGQDYDTMILGIVQLGLMRSAIPCEIPETNPQHWHTLNPLNAAASYFE